MACIVTKELLGGFRTAVATAVEMSGADQFGRCLMSFGKGWLAERDLFAARRDQNGRARLIPSVAPSGV